MRRELITAPVLGEAGDRDGDRVGAGGDPQPGAAIV
jgi:hypothetical protein